MASVYSFNVCDGGVHHSHGNGRGQSVHASGDGNASKGGPSALLVPLDLNADVHGAGPDDLAYVGACVRATPHRGDASGHGLH